MNSLGDANPVVRVLLKAAPREMTGQGAPGMSWSTVVANLRLHDGTVPRAQGQLCGHHDVAASDVYKRQLLASSLLLNNFLKTGTPGYLRPTP